MRLGQLARKLSIKTTEILSFIEEKEGPEISNHPNSKVPDEFVDDILEHFTPSPVEEIQKIIDSTEEAPKVEEVTETVEEIEEENIISKEDLKELAEVVAEKTASKAAEVISKTQDDLAQEEEPTTAAEEIEASEEVSDEMVADFDDTEINIVDGVIKAPKVDLEGPKVVGKIDLPEPKAPEVEEPQLDEDGNPIEVVKEEKPVKPRKKQVQKRSSRKKSSSKPTLTEYEKRQLEIDRLKKIEQEKLNRKKASAKKAYEAKMANKPSQPVKKKKKVVAEAPKKINKYEKAKPTTAWGKFMKWLNT